jgi:hypothetical protein
MIGSSSGCAYPRHLQQLHKVDGELVDLAAIDVLRVRERGVPRYNEFRRLLRLMPAASFEELTDNPAWAEELRQATAMWKASI